MGTSPDTFNKVKNLLRKLDDSIDSARSRRLTQTTPARQAPSSNTPTPAPTYIGGTPHNNANQPYSGHTGLIGGSSHGATPSYGANSPHSINQPHMPGGQPAAQPPVQRARPMIRPSDSYGSLAG
ncbi:MAG TPA: hypothetical protein VG797_05490 [Phycisphaerales bacterium]|nr:hypothetical protein [Phycisphaerales bacterium]